MEYANIKTAKSNSRRQNTWLATVAINAKTHEEFTLRHNGYKSMADYKYDLLNELFISALKQTNIEHSDDLGINVSRFKKLIDNSEVRMAINWANPTNHELENMRFDYMPAITLYRMVDTEYQIPTLNIFDAACLEGDERIAAINLIAFISTRQILNFLDEEEEWYAERANYYSDDERSIIYDATIAEHRSMMSIKKEIQQLKSKDKDLWYMPTMFVNQLLPKSLNISEESRKLYTEVYEKILFLSPHDFDEETDEDGEFDLQQENPSWYQYARFECIDPQLQKEDETIGSIISRDIELTDIGNTRTPVIATHFTTNGSYTNPLYFVERSEDQVKRWNYFIGEVGNIEQHWSRLRNSSKEKARKNHPFSSYRVLWNRIRKKNADLLRANSV